jgi:hypothetical protein
LWLAYAASSFRLLGLALNFVTGVNVHFREVTAMDQMPLWGGAVASGPVGVANPWAIVPQIGNVLLIVFVLDAAVTLWRRGGPDARRRAAVVGGSLVICVTEVAGFAALTTLGIVHAPSIVMPGILSSSWRWPMSRLGPDQAGQFAAQPAPASSASVAVEAAPARFSWSTTKARSLSRRRRKRIRLPAG